ncbi:putative porin [Microbulbifer bruguierae]|uniref:Porin n=1 Tax=Microbulbifer bruguierae TaxID=3029061 RepID=A0ABY8NAJ6_9GAMM|nr:putative porin [Microbulbifer bruguierae]WGL15444.1 putative porin [Microbulbifer bruguierae]
MNFKFALPLMLASAVAGADQYQSFTDVDFISADYGNFDADILSLQSQYYFGALNSLGPRKEFSYILPVNNIYGGLAAIDTDVGDNDVLTLGGEYYTGQWKLFGELADDDFSTDYSAGVGFLFSPNLLGEIEAVKREDESTDLYVRGKYNHQLTATDYIGFTAEIGDDFDYRSVSTKYFTALAGGQYLTAGLGLQDSDNSDLNWFGEVEFYFNENTSVGGGYGEDDTYFIDATHFFNRNVAGKVAYGSNRDFNDADIFSIGVTVQL